MEINPVIPNILKQHNIDVDEGLLVLMGIYFKLDVDRILPEETVKAINLTKIVERDYTLRTTNWNVNLFDTKETITNWSWVVDWIEPFGKINEDRKGSWRDAMKRMQDFFKQYPEYRKKDVYAARDLYLSSVKDARYLMHSHKFIFDGIGAMKKSTLLQYCERLYSPDQDKDMDIRGRLIT